jgi:hypothetical protein
MAREMIDCPNHEGAYDCTPFCRICEGNQGYYPTNELPERINVMKVISYDVQNITESIIAMNTDRDFDSITLEEVMEQVEAWVQDDFPADRIKDLIIQDENGEEL